MTCVKTKKTGTFDKISKMVYWKRAFGDMSDDGC